MRHGTTDRLAGVGRIVRATAWACACLCVFPESALAQTSSIPLSTLAPAPQAGTLPNGVSWSVNVGQWYSPAPSNTQGYILYPPQSPQVWTFDVPVSLRFGLRGMNISGECFRVPVGTVAEFIHPNHSWTPATRQICRAASGPNDESVFTIAGPVTQLTLEVFSVNSAGRGVGFLEVTVDAGIDIDKTATGPDPLVVGSTINYAFLVTNTGDVNLSNVMVTDPLPGMSPIACPGSTLTAGAGMTCTASYVVTQNDVNNGFVTNTATVTGDPPGSVAPVSAQDSATIPPTQTRSIALVKTASAPDAAGVVAYSFEVTNTGNVMLNGVAVTDSLPGLSAIACPATTLVPTQSMTCSATRALTQADIDAGFVSNTATATGTPAIGAAVSDQDSATVSTGQAVGIGLAKTGSGPDPLTLGATVSYAFDVTNTGQLQLSGVAVADPLPGLSPIVCPATTLAPGASMTCTAAYTVSQADVDAGFLSNTATAIGNPPGSTAQVSATASASVPPSQTRGIALEKTGTGPSPLTAGATVTYTFLVTNTGNVSLSNVAVTDPLPGLSAISCPATTLAAGASMTCTATYVATPADANAGSIANTAMATGQPPSGPAVTDLDSATMQVSVPVPALPAAALALLASLLGGGAAWMLQRRRRDV